MAVDQCRPWWRPGKRARAPRGEGDAGAQDRRGRKGGGSYSHERRPTAAMAGSGGGTRPNWPSPEHEPRRCCAPGKAEGEAEPGCGESKGDGVAWVKRRRQWHGGCCGELRCGRRKRPSGVRNGEDGEGSGSGRLLGGVARPLGPLRPPIGQSRTPAATGRAAPDRGRHGRGARVGGRRRTRMRTRPAC
jgi:hypothetical protein